MVTSREYWTVAIKSQIFAMALLINAAEIINHLPLN